MFLTRILDHLNACRDSKDNTRTGELHTPTRTVELFTVEYDTKNL